MSVGKVIRRYRKMKNLTQEEMAERLGVTAPAVNKWENENSYPDILLLAPIARLLGISLDTLLSFREELTAEEVNEIVREADQKLKMESFETAFEWVRKKLEEYPNCEMLILNLAVLLEAQCMLQDVPKMDEYDGYVHSLYLRVLSSTDETVRVRAADALVGRCMRKKQYEEGRSTWRIFLSRIRSERGSRLNSMRRRDGSGKPAKRMRNCCFPTIRERVWSCTDCICWRCRIRMGQERVCWRISKRNWHSASKWGNTMRFPPGWILRCRKRMQIRRYP